MNKEKNSNSVNDFWVYKGKFTPRSNQTEVFNWLDSLPPSVKYYFIEVPVGSGKSGIGATLSAYLANKHSISPEWDDRRNVVPKMGDAYILTPQKILQDQYENTFSSDLLMSLKGKSNYTCEQKKTDCESGSDIKPICSTCPHRKAVKKSLQIPNVVLNYKVALLYWAYVSDRVPKRNLTVFDECHTIENHLIDLTEMEITKKNSIDMGVSYKMPKSVQDALLWIIENYLPALEDIMNELSSELADIISEIEVTRRQPTKEERSKIKKMKRLQGHKTSLDILLDTGSNKPDQLEEIKKKYVLNINAEGFTFKEVFGKRVFKQIVDKKSHKFLFMSSTILNYKEFCKELGIKKEEAAFISTDSEFDTDKRPIYYRPVTKMKFGWDRPENKKNTDRLVDEIVKIANEENFKTNGIIHTGSFNISWWLVKELYKHPDFDYEIIHHNPSKKNKISRDDAINQFMSPIETTGKPKVLISPSITEGLDLKDDLARWAIFAKVPFGSLADPWTKRRMELSGEWYQRQAMINIIQGGGRVVRSSDDWGKTYILDSCFGSLYNMYKNKVPKWYKKSLIWET